MSYKTIEKRISGSSTKFNDIKRQIEEQETLIENGQKRRKNKKKITKNLEKKLIEQKKFLIQIRR